MSRANYNDDIDDPLELGRWRGAVKKAINGKRGQAFLRELLSAMYALPTHKLVANVLEEDGAVCAIGAVGRARGISMSDIDPEDTETVARLFGIADALVREIAYENDEGGPYWGETPEQRFCRMQEWVIDQIRRAALRQAREGEQV